MAEGDGGVGQFVVLEERQLQEERQYEGEDFEVRGLGEFRGVLEVRVKWASSSHSDLLMIQ